MMPSSLKTDKRIEAILGQQQVAVTIAGSAAVSSEIDLRDRVLLGLAVEVLVPWTGANIGFEVSQNGGASGTWVPLYDEFGARIVISGISTTVRRVYAAPTPAAWIAKNYPFLRLVSLNTSTGANINQATARQLVVSILT